MAEAHHFGKPPFGQLRTADVCFSGDMCALVFGGFPSPVLRCGPNHYREDAMIWL